MKRMGHTTTRAALIFLHSRDERDRLIADSSVRWPSKARRAYQRMRDESAAPAPTVGTGTLSQESSGTDVAHRSHSGGDHVA
jgi:hypothetical protein